MQAAPLRANEVEALAALRRLDVLDSAPEHEFDRMVQAAAAVCKAPIALISLIDAERQWFKAEVGFPGMRQTSRDIAFCAHAVCADALFEVPNATLDPRFADNPLVAGDLSLRLYAGAPITLGAGEVIGTLCVIDHVPRMLDAMQKELLMCLSVTAEQALEARRILRMSTALLPRLDERRRHLTRINDALRSELDSRDGSARTTRKRRLRAAVRPRH